jgi:hypothetical protein
MGSIECELPPGSVDAEVRSGKPSWADPQGKMSGRSLPEDRKTYKDRRTISGENAPVFLFPTYSTHQLTAFEHHSDYNCAHEGHRCHRTDRP